MVDYSNLAFHLKSLSYRVSHSEMVIYRRRKKIENGQFFNNNMFFYLYSRKLNDFLIFENMSEFVVLNIPNIKQSLSFLLFSSIFL